MIECQRSEPALRQRTRMRAAGLLLDARQRTGKYQRGLRFAIGQEQVAVHGLSAGAEFKVDFHAILPSLPFEARMLSTCSGAPGSIAPG
jgi:hypothetical protein